jgi:hypothetical protein
MKGDGQVEMICINSGIKRLGKTKKDNKNEGECGRNGSRHGVRIHRAWINMVNDITSLISLSRWGKKRNRPTNLVCGLSDYEIETHTNTVL